jgi:ribosomal protein S14
MKHSSAIDKQNRFSIYKQEFDFRLFRVLRSNGFVSPVIRANCAYKLFFLVSLARVHNYCSITLRSRGVLREFRISRLEFKKFAGLNLLSGVKRSSH